MRSKPGRTVRRRIRPEDDKHRSASRSTDSRTVAAVLGASLLLVGLVPATAGALVPDSSEMVGSSFEQYDRIKGDVLESDGLVGVGCSYDPVAKLHCIWYYPSGYGGDRGDPFGYGVACLIGEGPEQLCQYPKIGVDCEDECVLIIGDERIGEDWVREELLDEDSRVELGCVDAISSLFEERDDRTVCALELSDNEFGLAYDCTGDKGCRPWIHQE